MRQAHPWKDRDDHTGGGAYNRTCICADAARAQNTIPGNENRASNFKMRFKNAPLSIRWEPEIALALLETVG